MNAKTARLIERRERLIQLAAQQRTDLARSIEPWRAPLARVDQGLEAVRALRRNPAWLISGMVLLVALRPRRALSSRSPGRPKKGLAATAGGTDDFSVPGAVLTWMRRGWLVWQILKRLRH